MRAERIGRVLRKFVSEKQALREAKKMIGEIEKSFGKNGERWIKDSLENESGFCLLGAINNAGCEYDTFDSEFDPRDIVFTSIKGAIPGHEVDGVDSFSIYNDEVASYNDEADREWESIKKTLKRAKKAIGFALSGEKR